jgi:hypothetical protein
MRLFRLQNIIGVSVFSCFLVLPAPSQQPTQDAASPRQPVLVELFTSEGCSDCPPADEVLKELDSTQPVAGAQAIVLSEHVTYWDHQGWRDPFSLAQMTERQQEYVDRFGLDDGYTPQVVVDGAAQMVGNNSAGVTRAVAVAAAVPKPELVIKDARWQDGVARFSVQGTAAPVARLVAVLAVDASHSEVLGGENRGRTLHHVAVVRVMKDFGGDAADGRALQLADGELDRGIEATAPVRLVVFQVDHYTGRVIAVAEQTLSRPTQMHGAGVFHSR